MEFANVIPTKMLFANILMHLIKSNQINNTGITPAKWSKGGQAIESTTLPEVAKGSLQGRAALLKPVFDLKATRKQIAKCSEQMLSDTTSVL
jgi:hypothetical protein